MNKLVFPLFAVFTVLSGIFIFNSSFSTMPDEKIWITDNQVKEIIKTSCNDCHGKGSKNEDALEGLNLDTFDKLGKVKKITKLKEMSELIAEREMPPQKYIAKNPKAELTDDQIKVFTQWADQEIKKLIGN